MSSRDKKIWTKPDLTSFADTAEAIAYFLEHGQPEHAAAIERMATERSNWESLENKRLRKVAPR